MEKRIQLKIDRHINDFKEKLIENIEHKTLSDTDAIKEMICFIKTRTPLILTSEDFVKRKRVKNSVPFFERCIAKRADKEQCTRRRKDSEQFCGTHLKGSPHGTIENANDESGIELPINSPA